MPEYLISGRRADGRKMTESVAAGSADEAVEQFRARGFDQIVLHSDEVMAAMLRPNQFAEHISPRELLLMRNLPRGVGLFLTLALKGYRSTWLVMLFVALILANNRWLGRPWGFWDWVNLAILLFPLVIACVAAVLGGLARGQYDRMNEVLNWGRWEECLQLADQLDSKVPDYEIAFRKAKALAGMGRLEEGLALVEPFGDGKALPEWLYWARHADLYGARRRDEQIAELERSLELSPGNATVLIDLAGTVLLFKHDARRARALLREAREHALNDIAVPFAELIEGFILLEEGRHRDALPILEGARKAFHARAHMGTTYLAEERAVLGLALAHAGLGENEQALKLYRKVRPRLAALKSDLLERCDRAIGMP